MPKSPWRIWSVPACSSRIRHRTAGRPLKGIRGPAASSNLERPGSARRDTKRRYHQHGPHESIERLRKKTGSASQDTRQGLVAARYAQPGENPRNWFSIMIRSKYLSSQRTLLEPSRSNRRSQPRIGSVPSHKIKAPGAFLTEQPRSPLSGEPYFRNISEKLLTAQESGPILHVANMRPASLCPTVPRIPFPLSFHAHRG